MNWKLINSFLPEIISPKSKKLAFKTKVKWTLGVMVLYFVLLQVPLIGLGQNALERFFSLSIIFGASFGSLLTLGIGPIVTASIVLQLLAGSGILKLDLTKPEGKQQFQAMQKVFTIGFIILESFIYVFMGGLAPAPALIGTSSYVWIQLALVGQMILGGYLIVLLDEVVQKWGFGSGVSLFIAGGVARQIFITALSPLPSPSNPNVPTGQIPYLFKALSIGEPIGALIAVIAIVATIAVFLIAVYGQAMKVEIPLSFGRVRGYGIRWPLRFIYSSNIPVILIAALLANIQLLARLFQNLGYPILGTFQGTTPASGLVKWLHSPDIVRSIITGTATSEVIMQAVVYTAVMVFGAILFSILWVKTSNGCRCSGKTNLGLWFADSRF